MNKKMREIKADIESLNKEATTLFEAKDYEGAQNKLDEIDKLEQAYKVAEKLFKEEKEEVSDEVIAKSKANTKIANFAKGFRNITNSMNETTGTEGGYTVPEDVVADIEHLREAKASLQDLVSVEAVTKMSGRRTYKKRSSQTGFTKVGESGKIGVKNTPQYDKMEYKIEKYAGIYPATNELIEDSDANIYQEITSWIADESRVTRNQLILQVVNQKEAIEISDLDGIKKVLNVILGQAFKPTSNVITNDDGLNWLDTLKDSDGNYLLQPSPADPMKLVLAAGANTIPVKPYPNQDVPSVPVYSASTDATVQEGKEYYTRSGSEGSYVYTLVEEPTGNPSTSSYYEVTATRIPMIIGDLKEGIKLFDRKKLNILASSVAAAGDLNAFEEDLTLYRAIEREDVVMRDTDAFVNAYIEISTSASI